MKKTIFLLIPFFYLMLLFISCGEDNVSVKIGEEFQIEGNPITILKLEEQKALRSTTEDETVQIAPKGKKYIYFEVKNPKNEMIFLKVFNKDQELNMESGLYNFTHDLDSGFEDAYYLVDETTTIEKIVITTPSDTQYIVLNPTVTKNGTSIPEEIYTIIDSYDTGTAIGLLEGFAPYIKDGKSVFEVATQEGEISASNILSNKAEVKYFTEDGKKYVFHIRNVLDRTAVVTSYWEDGKITNLEVVEY